MKACACQNKERVCVKKEKCVCVCGCWGWGMISLYLNACSYMEERKDIECQHVCVCVSKKEVV